jgi:hypothetical protein
MAFSFQPKIISNGLVLYLDAANTKSYPGSGTTWNDLISTQRTGSLTNGPTFSSEVGGSIVFDGANDYINMGDDDVFSPSTGFTFDIFFKPYTILNGSILEKYSSDGKNVEYNFAFYNSELIGWVADTNSSNYRGRKITSGSLLSYTSVNKWTHFCFVYDGGTQNSSIKIYVNGSNIDNSDFSAGTFTSMKNTITPLTFANANWGSGIISGSLGTIKLYNRSLSTTEILQNYNALKGRFGLT